MLCTELQSKLSAKDCVYNNFKWLGTLPLSPIRPCLFNNSFSYTIRHEADNSSQPWDFKFFMSLLCICYMQLATDITHVRCVPFKLESFMYQILPSYFAHWKEGFPYLLMFTALMQCQVQQVAINCFKVVQHEKPEIL